jgi:hypothetical protein
MRAFVLVLVVGCASAPRTPTPAADPLADECGVRAGDLDDMMKQAIANNAGEVCIVELTEQRVARGDFGSLHDYAAWLVTTTPYDATMDAFGPFLKYPHYPAIERAAERVFDARSPWLPRLEYDHETIRRLLSRHDSTIAFAAFNRHLVASLGDTEFAAGLTVTRDELAMTFLDGTVTSFNRPQAELYELIERREELPGPGVHAVRVCDFYAWLLSAHVGAPEFRPYWPQARRDAALVTMIAWVKAQAGVHDRPETPRRRTIT